MEELREQTRDVLDGKPAQPKIFPQQVRGTQLQGHGFEHGFASYYFYSTVTRHLF